MNTTEPTVGPGLRPYGHLNLRVAELDGEADGFRYPVGLVIEVEAREPQSATTTEHADTPPTALDWSFTASLTCRRAHAPYCCGAGVATADLADRAVKWREGWGPERYRRYVALADRWHLNGMRAGCAHVEPVYETDRYGRTVPSLDLTPACPVTGYRYGHAWLHEIMPDPVAAELYGLLGVTGPTMERDR